MMWTRRTVIATLVFVIGTCGQPEPTPAQQRPPPTASTAPAAAAATQQPVVPVPGAVVPVAGEAGLAWFMNQPLVSGASSSARSRRA